MSDSADEVKAKIASFVDRAFENLANVDYYRVLGVSSASNEEQIRAAYYQLATYLHPDMHGLDVDPLFHSKLTVVFSRAVEAYKVLSDSEKRVAYDAGLGRGRMRMRSGTTMQPPRPEDRIENAKARRFYELSQRALLDKDLRSAKNNLRLALSMEPESDVIKDELARLEKLSP